MLELEERTEAGEESGDLRLCGTNCRGIVAHSSYKVDSLTGIFSE